MEVADDVDDATDIAAGLFTIASGGTVAVPTLAIKIAAKAGKFVLKKAIKSLKKQVAQIARRSRRSRVGINLKVKCKWGAPYPSLGVYR